MLDLGGIERMDLRAVTLIAVCVAVTIVLRFLPFVIFGKIGRASCRERV